LWMDDGSVGEARYRSPWLTLTLPQAQPRLVQSPAREATESLWQLIEHNALLEPGQQYGVTEALQVVRYCEKYLEEKDRSEMLQDIQSLLQPPDTGSAGRPEAAVVIELCSDCGVSCIESETGITVPVGAADDIFHAQLSPEAGRIRLRVQLLPGVRGLPAGQRHALALFLLRLQARAVRPVLDKDSSCLFLEALSDADSESLAFALDALAAACTLVFAEVQCLAESALLAGTFISLFNQPV